MEIGISRRLPIPLEIISLEDTVHDSHGIRRSSYTKVFSSARISDGEFTERGTSIVSCKP